MKKKQYIAPSMLLFHYQTAPLLNGGSIVEKEDDTATVTPDEEEYNKNDWGARRRGVWDDNTDENNKW